MATASFSRILFTGQRFQVKSFMFAPSVRVWQNTNYTIQHFPVIQIQYMPDKYTPKEDHPDPTFKVNPKSQLKVVNFFNQIYSWFHSYEDLFMIDDTDGKMKVNLDYRKLCVVVRGSWTETQIMKAEPAVINIDSKEYQGCVLYINNSKNAVLLREDEVEGLLGILQSFNFQNESLLLMHISEHKELWRDEENPNVFSSSYDKKPGKNPFA